MASSASILPGVCPDGDQILFAVDVRHRRHIRTVTHLSREIGALLTCAADQVRICV